MKKMKKKMTNKVERMLLVESGVILALILMIVFLNSNINIPCYILKNYGIICPSCGGTRMMGHLLAGHMDEAFMMHPIFFISILYLCFLNGIFIINSFRENEIGKWIYPNKIYIIIFIIALIVFTIVRNMI